MGNDMHVNYIILIVVVCAWLSMHIKMLEGFNNELSKAIKKLSYTLRKKTVLCQIWTTTNVGCNFFLPI